MTGTGRRWYRGDCHVHSVHSAGGELTPHELATAAHEAGLDFIVATEHNTTAGREAWAAEARDDLLVILGQEVVTPMGHWLALGVGFQQVVEFRHGSSLEAIGPHLNAIRREGGIVVAAHPHAPYPGGKLRYAYHRFDAIEVWNGLWASDRAWNANNEAALADWDRLLTADIGRRRWIPAIGNSDTHLPDQIGNPQTVVLADRLRPSAILTALREGHSWIAGSGGLDVSLTVSCADRTADIGGTLTTEAAPVSVRAAAHGVPSGIVRIRTNVGEVQRLLLGPTGVGSATWRTTASQSRFVRVEVRHPDGRMAMLTNPIILE